MPSQNDDKNTTDGFSHISVGKIASSKPQTDGLDDEEVIEIGQPTVESQKTAEKAAPSGSAHTAPAKHKPAKSARSDDESGWKNESSESASENDDKRAEDEVDYSVDNLEPMPVSQKITLFAIIIIIVIVGTWIFNYYTGGNLF